MLTALKDKKGGASMDLRELFVSFVLGLVEGLTEFIPVSSTGHMIIVDDLLLQSYLVLGSYELANTFKVVIQFGSILAVVIIFWKRLKTMILHSIHRDEKEEEHLKLSHIIIGLIPAMIAGLLLEPVIDAYLFRIETVIIGLLLGALLMFVADRNEQKPGRSLDSITYKDAFLIGLYQCLALWPGFSRSGATISGGVLFGYSHRAAADFTFIMAVPIMFGASVLSLYKKWALVSVKVLPFFTIGFISAFIFAYFSIRFFLRLIDRIKLAPFAGYRILLACLLLVLYTM